MAEGADLFQVDGRTDGRTDIAKFGVALRNFEKALKKSVLSYSQSLLEEFNSCDSTLFVSKDLD